MPAPLLWMNLTLKATHDTLVNAHVALVLNLDPALFLTLILFMISILIVPRIEGNWALWHAANRGHVEGVQALCDAKASLGIEGTPSPASVFWVLLMKKA